MLISHIIVDPKRLDPSGPWQEAFADLSADLSADLNAEYVELRNETAQPLDISDWTLRKVGTAFPAFQFPPGTAVRPRSSLRIHTGEGNSTDSDYYWGLRESLWGQIGDAASLQDAGGTLVDQRAYPTLPLSFRARTSPLGLLRVAITGQKTYRPAIELAWDLPIVFPLADTDAELQFPDPEAMGVGILRRQWRFPGRNRRGVIPTELDLTDGRLIYGSTTFHSDFAETQSEWDGDYLITTTRQYRYREAPQDARDRILVRTIQQIARRTSALAEGLLPLKMTVRYFDRLDLKPGEIYDYTAFVDSVNRPLFNTQTQDSALATGYYDHQLFTNLPQIHQRLDTVTPVPDTVPRCDQTKGQLQRFLEVMESHTDLLHGLVEGLGDLHHPQRVDSRLLPHLAHLIGWHPKDYLNEAQQRNEISFAPEIYKTVGTIPTIKATINRVIQWDAEVREFGRNVLRSFDASRLETRGDRRVYLEGSLDPPSVPAGSVDMGDAVAITNLRANAFDDKTAYTYDTREPETLEPSTRRVGWYNQQTIGIYMSPQTVSDVFTLEEAAERIYQILREFLPIQVRVVFFILLEDTESYETLQRVQESWQASGTQMMSEASYGLVVEASTDTISGWRILVANHPNHLTTALPFRSWHSALNQVIENLPDDSDGDG